jgi:hypothetical protein
MTVSFLFRTARRVVLLAAAFGMVVATTSSTSSAQEADKKVQLLFSDRADGTDLKPDLVLRPNLLQPVFVYVRNAKDAAEEVVVEVRAGADVVEGGSVKIPVPAGKTLRVPFGKAAPAAAPAAPAPVKEPVLAPLAGATEIRLSSGPTLLQEVKLAVIKPTEYVNVTSVEFDPRERGGVKNRLTVKVEATKTFAGPKCKAELILRADRVPGLIEGKREGSYAGYVTRAGDTLTLVAENLTFAAGGGKNGLVYVNVDGYPRAFTFVTTFGGGNTPFTGQEVRQPVLRLQAPTMAPPSGAYHVGVEVDNPPAGAVAELTVTRTGDDGEVKDSEVLKFAGDRRERLLFGMGGSHGALLFKPEVQDWGADLDVSEVYGKRLLKLRLLDGDKVVPVLDSRQVGSWKEGADNRVNEVTLPILFDSTKPENIRFLDFPPQLTRGSLLPIKATASDPESGIVSAVFFAGKPQSDGKIPENALVAEGKLDPKTQVWSAELPVSTTLQNTFEVSARFTNGAGLSATETIRIQLVDPGQGGANSGVAGGGAGAAGKPSSIAGTVRIGELAQPNLEVNLRDDKNNVKATTKTDNNGKFVFKDVAPGAYKVTAARPAAKVKGEAPVSVGGGEQKTGVDVKLVR